MKKKFVSLLVPTLLLSGLASCQSHNSGKIIFDLNGGSFPGQGFSTTYLEGEAGKRVMVDIPDPVKEGYFFVGWREMTKDGGLRVINLRYDDQGVGYYVYPFGSDTFFAYFEPLSTIHFDLTTGKDKNGLFVAPKEDTEHFNENEGVLGGYVSKKIASSDYLPTATADNMTFQYWYTDYPLLSKTSSSGTQSVTHYVEDTSKEKGVYPFEEQFGNNLMEFPEMIDGDFTLYAYWNVDPLVNVHFNLDDVTDTSFYFKHGMADKLKETMKDALGIDLDTKADAYYYPSTTKAHRFAGVYLDENMSDTPFYFNSTDPVKDTDCYLKWDDLVKVHFDFNGGLYNGSDVLDVENTFYTSDTLASVSSFVLPSPLKTNSTFLHYEVNGTVFDENTIITSSMLDTDGTLNVKAVYQDDAKLTIHFDFPDGYVADDSVFQDQVFYYPEGEDITNDLVNAWLLVTDPSLEPSNFYTLDSDSKQHVFDAAAMPGKNTDVYLKVNYLTKVTIHTISNIGGEYQPLSAVSDEVRYLKSPLTEDDFLDPYTDASDRNRLYLFDGFFDSFNVSEKTFGSELFFPLYGEPSHTAQPTIEVYRRMTKSAVMTLHYGSETAQLPILPGHTIAEYEDEIAALTSLSSFHIYSDSDYTREILSILPLVDSDLYVKA